MKFSPLALILLFGIGGCFGSKAADEFTYSEVFLSEDSAPIPLSQIATFPLKTAIDGSCYSRNGDGRLRKEDKYKDGVQVKYEKTSECPAG